MPSLCETYHPKAWSEIVGQDRVVRQVELIRRRNGCLVGRNYWISGLSGTGKSTMADLIAREAADDICIHELVGREIGVKDIKELRPELERCRGFGPGGRVCIINEAHTLSKHVIELLLDACDQRNMRPWVSWVFTTTLRGQASLFDGQIDAHPLLSRCTKLELTTDALAYAFANRAKEIATVEGLDFGAPIERYHSLIVECQLNFRDVLNRLEAGEFMDFTGECESAAPARKLMVARR